MEELVRRYTLEEAKAFIDQRKIEGQSSGEWTLRNNMIRDVKIECVGHFGGLILLTLVFESWLNVFGLRNMTPNLGYILRELALLLGLVTDGNINVIEALKNQPVRLFALTGTGRVDAELAFIGHFMEDKFVWCADLATAGWPKSDKKKARNDDDGKDDE